MHPLVAALMPGVTPFIPPVITPASKQQHQTEEYEDSRPDIASKVEIRIIVLEDQNHA
jgi:hypothetical protein